MKTRLLIITSFALGTSALTTGCDKGANLIASAYSKAGAIETKLVGMLDQKLNQFLATPDARGPVTQRTPGMAPTQPRAFAVDPGNTWNGDEDGGWAPSANMNPGFGPQGYDTQGDDTQGYDTQGYDPRANYPTPGGFDDEAQGFVVDPGMIMRPGQGYDQRVDPGFNSGFDPGFDQGFDQGGGWAVQQPATGFDFAQHQQRMADQAQGFKTYLQGVQANSDRNFQAVDNWTKTVIRGE